MGGPFSDMFHVWLCVPFLQFCLTVAVKDIAILKVPTNFLSPGLALKTPFSGLTTASFSLDLLHVGTIHWL